MKRILVIGGGAAGMMAAITAAEHGASVTLLEQNEKTGKKIYITGKGRCNLTNACEPERLMTQVISNGKFLYSAFSYLDNRAVMEFFEASGCPLKEERGERIFPISDHSSDVIAALNRRMEQGRVKVRLHTRVKELLVENMSGDGDRAASSEQDRDTGKKPVCEARICGVVLENGERLIADAVIVATGGISYESTGATGDGYRFAADTGHDLKERRPALVPLAVKESWCMQLQGLSLRNVSVRMTRGKKKIYEGFGEMLFTHFGVSGPLVLSASSYYVKKHAGQEAELSIDLKPALSAEQLTKRLLRDFDENKNKQFKNVLEGLFPGKLIPVMVQLSGIPGDKPVHDITKAERDGLVHLTKNLTMTIIGTRGFTEAIITQGGVSTKEVNPSTMESKHVKNLYFAGEVLDVDALTGGFNLQIAWSTGALAGACAADF